MKKKSLKKLKSELVNFSLEKEKSKYICYSMLKKFKSSTIVDKKKYSKKDRRKNKVKHY